MALIDFVDQLSTAGASFSVLISLSFLSLADFNASTRSEALSGQIWSIIVSMRTVNTQHGQLVVLSLQKADGSCCSAWACGMLVRVAAKPY